MLLLALFERGIHHALLAFPKQNRSSASDFASAYFSLRGPSSVVCPTRAPCLNHLKNLHAIWQKRFRFLSNSFVLCYFRSPMTRCVRCMDALVCLWGLLFYSVSFSAVAGHSSFGQLLVRRMSVRAIVRFPEPFTSKEK